jgi:ribosome-binding ATPase
VEKRLMSLEKEAKAGNNESKKELLVFGKLKDSLNKGIQIRDIELEDKEKLFLKNYSFLTNKPCLYLLNGVDEDVDQKIISFFESNNYPYLIIDVKTEFEVVNMSKDERSTLGLTTESELDILIRRSYKLLDLITFFTTGEDETRA